MRRVWCGVVVVPLALASACLEQPQPQGPQQLTYQNGYAQTTYQNPNAPPPPPPATTQSQPITYTPQVVGEAPPQQTAPIEIQTTPVPLGVQPLPAPTTTATATATSPAPTTTTSTAKTMAVPNGAAFQCQSDAQCLLGRCNVQYGRCAYPCKNSEVDCKAGNVCSASGVCMPRSMAGVKM